MAGSTVPAPRYVVQRELGRGGMGRVDLVLDRVRAEPVAQKRIAHPSPLALLRFKTEFRAIEQLRHPNLVALHELGQDEAGMFFTMEVVGGTDLATYCRPPTASARAKRMLDDTRLREVLPQLLGALAFLHDHGIAHCDLKPSNVMVDGDGVLKLLDFGILARFREDDARAPSIAAGTPGYMAPELLAGARPSAATDLYALGVILYALYTGKKPAPGASLAALCPQLPAAVARAVQGLVASDPRQRPSLGELAAAYELRPVRGSGSPPANRTFVGRERDVQALLDHVDRCHQGEFVAVALAGASGVGKSALASEIARIVDRSGGLVLRGRAHLRERVAFNGVDDAVDDLVKYLIGDGARVSDEALAEEVTAAAALFPALLARAPGGATVPALDRERAFAAFARLLERVAARAGPLVLSVDDLQWVDADAAALLASLVEHRPARVLLLATVRNDLPSLGSGSALLAEGAMIVHDVASLDDTSLEVLVGAAFSARGAPPPDADALARLVQLADGRPLLADLAVRAVLDGAAREEPKVALELRVGRLARAEQRVVAALLAGDGWLDASLVAECLREPRGRIDAALVTLERQGIVRLGAEGAHGRVADLFHDIVRTAAAASVAKGLVDDAHGGLCDALASRPETPDTKIVHHMLAAGREREAAHRAALAARRAFDTFAYGLAADLFAVALRDPACDAPSVLRARARAFELGGQYTEAASVYADLAARSTGADARNARLDEAALMLAAGDVIRGLEKLETSLDESGERIAGRWAQAWAAVRFLLGPLPVKLGAPAAADASAAADRDWRVAQHITYIEPLIGVAYLQRAQRRFIEAGESARAAGCDFGFAYWALFGRAKAGPVPLADAYGAAGSQRLVGLTSMPTFVRWMPKFLGAVADQRAGRRQEAAVALEEVLRHIEARGETGTFEHMLGLTHRVWLELARRDVRGSRTWVSAYQRALGRLQSAVRCHVEIAVLCVGLMEGRFDEMREHAAAMLAGWPDAPTYQRGYLSTVCGIVGVYAGDPIAERRRVAAAMRRDAKFRMMDNMYAGHLAANLALLDARALRAGDATVTRRQIERWARIARDAPPLGTSGVIRARAYVDEIGGESRERVLARLAEAEAHALREDMPVDAAIARYQRGERIHGSDGAALRDSARDVLRAFGVSERFFDENVA